MAIDPFATTATSTTGSIPVPSPAPSGDNRVHIALTYVAIGLFAALTLLFNVEWIVLKESVAQTQALALDAVVLAGLNLQAVKLPGTGA